MNFDNLSSFENRVFAGLGVALAVLMIRFQFIPNLQRPTNLCWALMGLAMTCQFLGRDLAVTHPDWARKLSVARFVLLFVSVGFSLWLGIQWLVIQS